MKSPTDPKLASFASLTPCLSHHPAMLPSRVWVLFPLLRLNLLTAVVRADGPAIAELNPTQGTIKRPNPAANAANLLSPPGLVKLDRSAGGLSSDTSPQTNPLATESRPSPTIPADPSALKWDADTKDFNAKPGDVSAPFTFVVTKVSDRDVSITKLRTSCGCTVAQLPSTPYKLDPNANVSLAVTLDLRGKSGTLTKSVTVDTSAGAKTLIVRANLPPATPAAAPVASAAVPSLPVASAVTQAAPAAEAMEDRAMNIQNALADRQAIFKGDCARCHLDKGVGKVGAELYLASCGICHEAEHRAAMVPNLKVPRSPRDLAFWQKWIAEGKPATLMPAFAATHGDPLTQEQADSLTVYLYQNFPRNPPMVLTTPPISTAASR